MKPKRWVLALVITMVVLFFLEAIQSTQNKVNGLQMQVRELSTKVFNIKVPNLTEYDTRLQDIDERITQYQQDIDFWNEQVGNMFGEHNARYFREGRGK